MASLLWSGLVIVSVLVAVGLVVIVTDARQRLVTALQSRLIYGIPIGSIITITIVLAVYLIVQQGLVAWDHPLVYPFRAWSYLSPTGIVMAGVAHSSPSHLLGNLAATAVLAPIAEYYWRHYPAADGGRSHTRADRWYQYPIVRAAVLFPGAAFLTALLTGLFAIGAVIGFSGVVFAFGGFALVAAPLVTVLALIAISALSVLGDAIADPIAITTVSAGPPAAPAWASISIQGHALGFVTGIILGVLLCYHRDRLPAGWRLFAGVVVYGLTQGLWIVFRYAGDGTYVLYRAVGVLVVFAGGLFLVGAAVADRTPLIERDTVVITQRTVIVVTLVAVLGALAGPGLLTNLIVATDTASPGDETLDVEGYVVGYGTDIEQAYQPLVDLPGVDELFTTTSSGVIIANDARNIWTVGVSPGQLAYSGTERIVVGGIGWRETVHVNRTGMEVFGNRTVYTVTLRHNDQTVQAYTSPPSTADLRLAGRTITIQVNDTGQFRAQIATNATATTVPIPSRNETVTAQDVTLTTVQVDDRTEIIATADGTRVQIAQREQYAG